MALNTSLSLKEKAFGLEAWKCIIPPKSCAKINLQVARLISWIPTQAPISSHEPILSKTQAIWQKRKK